MRRSRWAMLMATATGTVLAGAAMLPAGPAAARPVAGQAGASGPTIKLIALQHAITAQPVGNLVFIDPRVFVTAVGSPLRFDVGRASYADPIKVTQVMRLPGGRTVLRPLPRSVIDGWQGLRRFLRMTIVNAAGKVVGSQVLTFCPNSFIPDRMSPSSPANPRFPWWCTNGNPFIKSMVWGLQQGWGIDPLANGTSPVQFQLGPGEYTVRMSVTPMWRKLLHVSRADGTARVKVTVKNAQTCASPCLPVPATAGPAARRATALPRLPGVPLLANPPTSALPDMVPLPSWGISVVNSQGTTQRSWLTFGATVAVEGNAALDVEGFKIHGSSLLQAYQYFWRNGHVIGRVKAGTMGFEGGWGDIKTWHFQQFAQYRLLSAAKSLVVRNKKAGFCIVPTDAIDLTLPYARWRLNNLGLNSGECESHGAVWVREALPLGWADTYVQNRTEQAFNITNLPNGTYYIEIIANPERVLHESDYGNDASLRKVIIGGTPGNRTVRVPAYHGIDPES